jgi:hypothetical protein
VERWFGSTVTGDGSLDKVSGVDMLEELERPGELSESSKELSDDSDEAL